MFYYKTMDTKIISPDNFKDHLISKTATKTGRSEDIIDKIITFEFKELKDAVKHFSQVEITGFGKYLISNGKLKRKLGRLLDIEEAYTLKLEREEDMNEKRRGQLLLRLGITRENIEYLKARMR